MCRKCWELDILLKLEVKTFDIPFELDHALGFVQIKKYSINCFKACPSDALTFKKMIHEVAKQTIYTANKYYIGIVHEHKPSITGKLGSIKSSQCSFYRRQRFALKRFINKYV